MKLHLLDRSTKENSSITVKNNKYPFFLKIWHYHPELELVYVVASTGTRFIGDNIQKFDKSDLVLIGKNLPHMWLNDDTYFNDDSPLFAEAIAIHFKENFLGYDFLNAPEINHINKLLRRAKYGIKFLGNTKNIESSILELEKIKGFERTILFLKILNLLAKHSSHQLLATEGYINSVYINDNKYLDRVYEYVFKNFKNKINLSEVAEIAHMNPSAFSRFFKRVNRKTFTKYINEIRIGYACRLLIENKSNITAICYDSGFNNISNFNRQFKNITKMSPSEYLKRYDEFENF